MLLSHRGKSKSSTFNPGKAGIDSKRWWPRGKQGASNSRPPPRESAVARTGNRCVKVQCPTRTNEGETSVIGNGDMYWGAAAVLESRQPCVIATVRGG